MCDAYAAASEADETLDQAGSAEGSRRWLAVADWWIRTMPSDVPASVLRGLNRTWSLLEPDPYELELLDRVVATDENRWWLQATRASVLHRLERHAEAWALIESLSPLETVPERMTRFALLASTLRSLRDPSAADGILAAWERAAETGEEGSAERALIGLLQVPLVVLSEGSNRAVDHALRVLAALPAGRASWYRALLHWQLVVMTDTWQERDEARRHAELAVELLVRMDERWLLPQVLNWQVNDAFERRDTLVAGRAMAMLESTAMDGGPLARMIYCQARSLLAADSAMTDRWVRTGNMVAERSGRRPLLRRTMAEEVACLEVALSSDGSTIITADSTEVRLGASSRAAVVLRALVVTAMYPPVAVTADELMNELEQWRVDNRQPQTLSLDEVLTEVRAAGLGDALVVERSGYRLLGVRVFGATGAATAPV